jgi:hypothetical protein
MVKKFKDNDVYYFIYFLDKYFKRDGSIKRNAKYISSRKLHERFGSKYHEKVIEPLVKEKVLVLHSSDYKFVGPEKYTMMYRLNPSVYRFYSELMERFNSTEFHPRLAVKRMGNVELHKKYEESKGCFEYRYSKKTSRLHSPWTSVPRKFRHKYISTEGKFLVRDVDIRSAHWSMLLEFFHEFETEEYQKEMVTLEILLDKGIYNYFMESIDSEVTREEMKDMMNCILNSNSMTKLNSRTRKVWNLFKEIFPKLSKWIWKINEPEGMFVGGILNKHYEKLVIQNLFMTLNEHPIFNDCDFQIIFDGIEIFQDRQLTQEQEIELQRVLRVIESGYKFIRLELK